jgi:hypothetical protein
VTQGKPGSVLGQDRVQTAGPGREERISGELSGRQLALWRALKEIDGSLADMYLGARRALGHLDNPDQLPQAAHSARELMEKIPGSLGVTVKAHRESLRNQVRQLEVSWEQTTRKSSCFDGSGWAGEIDPDLQRLLGKIGDFFAWFGSHVPRRNRETTTTLTTMDGSRRALPTQLLRLSVSYWNEINEFFEKVCHHGKPETTLEEFDRWLGALEDFLLERLKPRTFEELEELDALMKRGDSYA